MPGRDAGERPCCLGRRFLLNLAFCRHSESVDRQWGTLPHFRHADPVGHRRGANRSNSVSRGWITAKPYLTRASYFHQRQRTRDSGKGLVATQGYSVRRTCIGEADAARAAGIKLARIAAASRTIATERKAVKSSAFTPNRRLCMARPTK